MFVLKPGGFEKNVKPAKTVKCLQVTLVEMIFGNSDSIYVKIETTDRSIK